MYSLVEHYSSFHEDTKELLPRILNLIIYNEEVPYENSMKQTLTDYLVTQPNVTFFFLCNRQQDVDVVQEGHTLYVKGSESLRPGILDKTISGLHYCITQRIPFSYFIRSNISTALQFSKFPYEEMKTHGHATTSVNHFSTVYASGTNIILNRDMAKYLLDHRHLLKRHEMDDVAIGMVLYSRENPHQLQQELHFQPHTDQSRFAYRHKSDDRDRDAQEMRELVRNFT